MFLSDTLSRAFLEDTGPEDLIDEEIDVNSVQLSQEKQDEIKQATLEDHTLQLLARTVLNGWPESIRKVPQQIRTYFTYRDEIIVEDDLLFKGKRLIIPAKLRPEMLYNIYQKLSNVKLQPSYVKLRPYSGHHLSPIGQALLNVNGSNIKFQIVSDVDPILGRDTCEQLGLIKLGL